MPALLDDLPGVLLAGGKSRRMGRDKRFLDLQGMSLLQRALSALERVFREVLIVCAEPDTELARLGQRVVTDLIPGCASLGGVYTGLSCAQRGRVFVVACDMPFLDPAMVRFMCARAPQADITMAKLAHGLQPMHAVYGKQCLPHLERMARQGNLKLQEIVRADDCSTCIVEEEELSSRDPQFLSFMNINTPADLELARKLISTRAAQEGKG